MSDTRLKRLRYRAWHRGTRELDLILGRFADAHLAAMSERELAAFEALVDAADPEIGNCVLAGGEAPAGIDRDLVARLRASLGELSGGLPR